jgi:hypothetical protein
VKRILASMLALAIAICFSFSMGCTPAKEGAKKDAAAPAGMDDKGDKKFAAEKMEGTLDKKDAKVEIAFKNGDPKEVDPKEKEGIKAAITDKKVVFTQPADGGAEDKTVEFTVKGGKDDKEEAKIKITIKKK